METSRGLKKMLSVVKENSVKSSESSTLLAPPQNNEIIGRARSRKLSAAQLIKVALEKLSIPRYSRSKLALGAKSASYEGSLDTKKSRTDSTGRRKGKGGSVSLLKFSSNKKKKKQSQGQPPAELRVFDPVSSVSFEQSFDDELPSVVGPSSSTPAPVHLTGHGNNGVEDPVNKVRTGTAFHFTITTDSSSVFQKSGAEDRHQDTGKLSSSNFMKLSSPTGRSSQSSKENVLSGDVGGGGVDACPHSRSSSPKASKPEKTGKTSTSSANQSRIQSAAASIKNFLVPNYKSRNEEFRRLFKNIPDNEKFVIDYACAVQKEILHQGRMYLSQRSVCFYANLFMKWETNIVIKMKDITAVTKERTAKVIPNAIQIETNSGDKYFFASFAARDRTYMMLFKMWQGALLDQIESPQDLWAWAQHGYDAGDISPSEEEDFVEAESPYDQSADNTGSSKVSEGGGKLSAADSSPKFVVGPDREDYQGLEADVGIPEKRKKDAKVGKQKKKRLKTEKGQATTIPGALSSSPAADEFTESSENDYENACPCTVHEGQEFVNGVYPLSVDQMFILLFTDCQFYRNFHRSRKTTDLELGEWVIDKDGTRTRNVSYTICLNHSMGPKHAGVQEKQTCNQYGKSGQVYVVKVEAQNCGVPYSDSFNIYSVYCLSRISANQCRFRCHASVIFRKNVWGIVKSFIEKNSFVGMQDHFSQLDKSIREECKRLGCPTTTSTPQAARVGAKGARTARSRVKSRYQKEEEKDINSPQVSPVRKYGVAGNSFLPKEVERVAKVILFIMVVMLVLNGFLFYKLWCLEAESRIRPRFPMDYSFADLKLLLENSELSSESLLMLYKFHQEQAAQRWMTALQATVGSLANVEEQLKELRQQLSEAQADFSLFGQESQKLKEEKLGSKSE